MTIIRKQHALYCGFCGKTQHEVDVLVAGPREFICDECIDLCVDIVRSKTRPAHRQMVGGDIGIREVVTFQVDGGVL